MPVFPTHRTSSNALRGTFLLLAVLLSTAGCVGAEVLQQGGHGAVIDPPPSATAAVSPSAGAVGTVSVSSAPGPSPSMVAATLAPGQHQLAMGLSTPDGLADKDAREDEIIHAI